MKDWRDGGDGKPTYAVVSHTTQAFSASFTAPSVDLDLANADDDDDGASPSPPAESSPAASLVALDDRSVEVVCARSREESSLGGGADSGFCGDHPLAFRPNGFDPDDAGFEVPAGSVARRSVGGAILLSPSLGRRRVGG